MKTMRILPPFPDVPHQDPRELRDPHARRVDGPDDEPVPEIRDLPEELKDLAVLHVHEFLPLHLRPVHVGDGVCLHHLLELQELVKGRKRRDDAVEGVWMVLPEGGKEGEKVGNPGVWHLDLCIDPRGGEVLPLVRNPVRPMAPEPDVPGEPVQDLDIALLGPLRVIPHVEVVLVFRNLPGEKMTLFHAQIYDSPV